MRNLSMKKFGTPIGAAPGTATDRAGLEIVGVPSAAIAGSRAGPPHADGSTRLTLVGEAGTLSSYA